MPQIQFFNSFIFGTRWCKPLIFQNLIIWSYSIHSWKYQRSTTLCCKDIEIRIQDFVAKSQFFYFQVPEYVFKIQLKLKRKNYYIEKFYKFQKIIILRNSASSEKYLYWKILQIPKNYYIEKFYKRPKNLVI